MRSFIWEWSRDSRSRRIVATLFSFVRCWVPFLPLCASDRQKGRLLRRERCTVYLTLSSTLNVSSVYTPPTPSCDIDMHLVSLCRPHLILGEAQACRGTAEEGEIIQTDNFLSASPQSTSALSRFPNQISCTCEHLIMVPWGDISTNQCKGSVTLSSAPFWSCYLCRAINSLMAAWAFFVVVEGGRVQNRQEMRPNSKEV